MVFEERLENIISLGKKENLLIVREFNKTRKFTIIHNNISKKVVYEYSHNISKEEYQKLIEEMKNPYACMWAGSLYIPL